MKAINETDCGQIKILGNETGKRRKEKGKKNTVFVLKLCLWYDVLCYHYRFTLVYRNVHLLLLLLPCVCVSVLSFQRAEKNCCWYTQKIFICFVLQSNVQFCISFHVEKEKKTLFCLVSVCQLTSDHIIFRYSLQIFVYFVFPCFSLIFRIHFCRVFFLVFVFEKFGFFFFFLLTEISVWNFDFEFKNEFSKSE